MRRNTMLILVVVMALLLAGLLVLAVVLETKQPEALPGSTTNAPNTTADNQVESIATPETTDPTETTQLHIPGVEDSVFDDDPTEGAAKPTDPKETEKNPNNPDDTTEPNETTESPKPGELSYEAYQAMSGAEQQAYMQTFPSMDAFFAWYNAAKAKYEEENPAIDVGDGSVDIGDLIGGNN